MGRFFIINSISLIDARFSILESVSITYIFQRMCFILVFKCTGIELFKIFPYSLIICRIHGDIIPDIGNLCFPSFLIFFFFN